MHHGPTVHPQRTCTGALPLAGPGSLRSHCGFKERRRKPVKHSTFMFKMLKIPCCLTQKLACAPILQIVYLLLRGIFVLQLLKEPEM